MVSSQKHLHVVFNFVRLTVRVNAIAFAEGDMLFLKPPVVVESALLNALDCHNVLSTMTLCNLYFSFCDMRSLKKVVKQHAMGKPLFVSCNYICMPMF